MNQVQTLAKLLDDYYGINVSALQETYVVKNVDDLIEALKYELSIWVSNF